jgi:hypothetical protein
MATQKLASFTEARERGALPELEEVAHALETWVKEFESRDTWLQDLALQTMDSWADGKRRSKWTYFPDELRLLRFQVDFGYWFPGGDHKKGQAEWPEFRRLADAAYQRELGAYRARVRKEWGEGSRSLSQHAVWTALFQRGRSPEAIQTQHRRAGGKNVSLSNIGQCIHEFAAAAGLTLRAAKAGRSANATTR